MFSMRVNNVQFVCEQCSVCEWIMSSVQFMGEQNPFLSLVNVQFVCEQVFSLRVDNIQLMSDQWSVYEWTKSFFKFGEVPVWPFPFCICKRQIRKNQYSVCELTIFSLLVNNDLFVREQSSACEWTIFNLRVNNVPFASEQCLAYELLVFSLWVNKIPF